MKLPEVSRTLLVDDNMCTCTAGRHCQFVRVLLMMANVFADGEPLTCSEALSIYSLSHNTSF